MDYLAMIGTRDPNNPDTDLKMQVTTLEIDAYSLQSAKRQATLHAMVAVVYTLKTGWRAWGKPCCLGNETPDAPNCFVGRDTLCTVDGRQSFIQLFWKGDKLDA